MRLNIAGIAFSGADVGGFFYTPKDELMIRWFQLGIYNPFFRSHAHHETARFDKGCVLQAYGSNSHGLRKICVTNAGKSHGFGTSQRGVASKLRCARGTR